MVRGSAPKPIARYTFTTNDCMQGFFPNTWGKNGASPPSFQRNRLATHCSKGMGIEPTTETIEHPASAALWLGEDGITDLLGGMKRTGRNITFEFWIKPVGETREAEASIFMLGSIKSARAPPTDACDDFDFQVIERQSGSLQITFRSSKPFPFYPCYRYVFPGFTVKPDKLIHLVVSLGNKHQQVFVNGHAGPLGSDAFFLKSWTDSSIMTFFSGVVLKDPLWQGRLYQFSIYDRVLTQNDVEQSLAAGLTGDEPYSTPYHVAVNEDAEAEPGSHPLDWYARPPSLQNLSRNQGQDLQRIPLRLRPVQYDVEILQDSLPLIRTENREPAALAYITGLPSRGSLFHFTGEGFVQLQQIRDEPIAILVEDPTSLVFLPRHNEHSEIPGAVYTSIAYCSTSRVIFDPIQCESSNIFISVNPINDPPIAFASPMSLQAIEGNETDLMPSIQLGGTDVDQQDSIAMIQITEPPKWGKLVLRVTSFRNDGLPHGTLFSSSNNYTIASHDSLDSVYVKYLFDGQDPTLPRRYIVPGNDATDYFRFRVSDQKGAWSLEENVHVDILSAVNATPTSPALKVSGVAATKISFNASDASGYKRPLATFIHSVPDKQYGNLLDANTDTTLEPGSQISDTNVFFLANSGFCTSSLPIATTKFAYRAVALDSEIERSISPVVTQDIDIQCPVPPIHVSSSSTLLHLRVFSLDSTNTTVCGDTIYENLRSPLVPSCLEAATVDRLQVATTHRNYQQQVVVTVKPGQGFVTFVEDAWIKVRPLQGRRMLASDNVTFQATLGDLEEVFNGLTYRSLVPGNTTLEIIVQYADCPNEALNQSVAANSSCPSASLSIPVTVDEGEPYLDDQSMPIPIGLLRHWLGYPISYFLYVKLWDTVSTLLGRVSDSLWCYICELGRIAFCCWCFICTVFQIRKHALNDTANHSVAASEDVTMVADQELPGLHIRDYDEEEEGNPRDIPNEDRNCWYGGRDEMESCSNFSRVDRVETAWKPAEGAVVIEGNAYDVASKEIATTAAHQ